MHQYISAANIKKVCEIGLLVRPFCIYLPIGGTGSFSTIYWCNWQCYHQYIGGTASAAPIYWWKHILKILSKSFSIFNRQCAAISAAPIMAIMGNGVMLTLFGVYSICTFFHSYNNFEGRGWEVGKGRLPIGQVSYRTPADWLYLAGWIIIHDISPHG